MDLKLDSERRTEIENSYGERLRRTGVKNWRQKTVDRVKWLAVFLEAEDILKGSYSSADDEDDTLITILPN